VPTNKRKKIEDVDDVFYNKIETDTIDASGYVHERTQKMWNMNITVRACKDTDTYRIRIKPMSTSFDDLIKLIRKRREKKFDRCLIAYVALKTGDLALVSKHGIIGQEIEEYEDVVLVEEECILY